MLTVLVFSREDAEIILKSGDLNFIQPLEIAKEFLNYQRVERQRKSFIIDAAKHSEYFDTNRAFFNDVTHRKSNNRV